MAGSTTVSIIEVILLKRDGVVLRSLLLRDLLRCILEIIDFQLTVL